MIERAHQHVLRPFHVYDRPDGLRDVHSRCDCGPGSVLEQRLTVDKAGEAREVRFRFGGLWFSALDLLRVGAGLGIAECPNCGGDPPPITGLGPCPVCRGAAVVAEDGAAVRTPALTTS